MSVTALARLADSTMHTVSESATTLAILLSQAEQHSAPSLARQTLTAGVLVVGVAQRWRSSTKAKEGVADDSPGTSDVAGGRGRSVPRRSLIAAKPRGRPV